MSALEERFALSQKFANPDLNDIEYQRYCFDLQKPSHHCGLMPFILVEGLYYQMTGLRDGWGVYVRFAEWRERIYSFSNEGYFVHREGELIPLKEYQFTTRREFVPYSY